MVDRELGTTSEEYDHSPDWRLANDGLCVDRPAIMVRVDMLGAISKAASYRLTRSL